MAGTLFRCALNSTLSLYKTNASNLRTIHTAPATYAARKGTRAKARAKKIKVEVTKIGFIPHKLRAKKTVSIVTNKHIDDSFKRESPDDVYPMRYYRWVLYSAEGAVRAHQETHHPTMYNLPDALVFAKVELNVLNAKKTKAMDSVSRLALLPHPFPTAGERSILAFCKTPELQKQALEAGATMVGGVDLVKKIQEGAIKLADYDHVIAHPNMITEMVPIRGLMKRRFPNLKQGTLDNDIGKLVHKYASGIQYKIMKDEQQQDYGCVEIPVGRLNMDAKLVAENIGALLKDIQAARPKRDGLFVTRCLIACPPATQTLKIDPFVFVDRELTKEVQEDSDDEQAEAVAA